MGEKAALKVGQNGYPIFFSMDQTCQSRVGLDSLTFFFVQFESYILDIIYKSYYKYNGLKAS